MPDETSASAAAEIPGEALPDARKKKKKKNHFLLWFLVKTAAFAGIVAFIVMYVLYFYRMDGNQMYPGLRDGDLAIFLRSTDFLQNVDFLQNIDFLQNLDLWDTDYYTDDVVLYEDAQGDIRPGRVVATGGQTVEFLEDGGYEVNGAASYDEVPYETYGVTDSTVENPVTLAEDEYFILNDFRSDTLDSRELGPVKRSQIKGKLLVLLRIRGF